MDLQSLQKEINKIMLEINSKAVTDFEDYSPNQLHNLLYDPFGSESPLRIQVLPDNSYGQSPLFNLTRYLLVLLHERGGLKLTATGKLPVKVVAEIYAQGFIKEWMIERNLTKIYKETDSLSVSLTHLIPMLAGLIKKRKGILSLTKAGEKALSDNTELMQTVFYAFAFKFNWGFYDGYGQNDIIQQGLGYSLLLLAKYGAEERHYTYYTRKFSHAFPYFPQIVNSNRTPEEYSAACYLHRTFELFCLYMGFISIRYEEPRFEKKIYITTTGLFRDFFAME